MQMLTMSPGTGERVLRFVGDRLVFTLRPAHTHSSEEGALAYLRTNLGRARQLRQEIIHAHTGQLTLATSPWRDIPMRWQDGLWLIELTLTEPGFFRAKAYTLDAHGWQHWPEGDDAGISVHPDAYRTANTIYCAFPRMFGPNRASKETTTAPQEPLIRSLENQRYAVLPPSGKLREVVRLLPHIMDTLGCRILHLLPVHPTPTTYARFGRFGSPYACQDLLTVDPALVEFDRKSTGIEQFQELTYAAHERGGKVFLDVVINHTGWGSTLQEHHPEWFVRDDDGTFVSPGAWGVTWEDLAELHHRNPALWEHMSDVFIEWCRRGVDGFRCDAGYKIPVPAWQYITARVRDEFPETVFLLEGLGGSWQATENLLTDGGMQWAYSELFQNYSGKEVSSYLDYCLDQCGRVGLYVHYSETHDNDRLAKRGRVWSLMRNQLCALTSVSGGFGFASGVEWLAEEKIEVHQSRGLAWGNSDNLLPELAALNRLLCEHPCFFDHARLHRLSEPESAVVIFSRQSAEGADTVLVLANTDIAHGREGWVEGNVYAQLGAPAMDLLTGRAGKPEADAAGRMRFALGPGECRCLAATAIPRGIGGQAYRDARAQAAWAVQALSQVWPNESIGPAPWQDLAAFVRVNPCQFLASIPHLDTALAATALLKALQQAASSSGYPTVARWSAIDARRCTPVPPRHWVLVEDPHPFRATLRCGDRMLHASSAPMKEGHAAFFAPESGFSGDAEMILERYSGTPRSLAGPVRFLSGTPDLSQLEPDLDWISQPLPESIRNGVALLTNQRGGMARIPVDLGRVYSKYDCVLGANPHPKIPVDRHIFVKRLRVWVNADGFLSPLHAGNLVRFTPGPPAEWRFIASAGDGRAVEAQLWADMMPGLNATVLRFYRPVGFPGLGRDLPDTCRVSLTVRFDILDRNFHVETQYSDAAAHHFASHLRALADPPGFLFAPAPDRQLRVWSNSGTYHDQPEWSRHIPHPVEKSRGQFDREDAYSPGWFELPLTAGQTIELTVSAESTQAVSFQLQAHNQHLATRLAAVQSGTPDPFGKRLASAVRDFVARRGDGSTVIAGFPWFLDWGRDTLICGRGLLAAGLEEIVTNVLLTFGRFEERGTIPNSIHGEDTRNRDTSDAPLWYGLLTEEMVARTGSSFYDTPVRGRSGTMLGVLEAIGEGYRDGTPNGIRLDPETGLIWSPSHFTWMDTNYPAGTPREGYPVEIQALWIRLCRQLAKVTSGAGPASWQSLADRAMESLVQLYRLAERDYLADVLVARAGQSARDATPDNALRSNYLLAISLGLWGGRDAQLAVEWARRYLVIPGALRSLAPLPVSPPLPIHGPDGRLLNHPEEPYWGHYEGEEDTRRKPAYHNGTAWTWTFPHFCEALAVAWSFEPSALAAARAYLASMDRHLLEGCLGQLPEVLDGDWPHTQRGCDAQAWGATEALRVWKLLSW